jgi:SAM-dependent methyltransferase
MHDLIKKSLLIVTLILVTLVPTRGQASSAPGVSAMVRICKRLWLRYNLNGATPMEIPRRLESLYEMEDPWHLQAERETVRFHEINALVRRHFPNTRTVLEIGSGEGLQTRHLLEIATQLYGVELSPTAVERARRRVPEARFYVGDFRGRPWRDATDRFDLIVACEVLYYLSDADLRDTVRAMSRLGRGCLVSFKSSAAERLARVLPLDAERAWIHCDGATWLVAWWRNVGS